MLSWPYFWTCSGSCKYTKKNFQKIALFLLCGIDPYLYGKLYYIQWWLARWITWRILFFGQSWHFWEKKHMMFFLEQFSQFSKINKALFKFLATILSPLRFIFFNFMLALFAISFFHFIANLFLLDASQRMKIVILKGIFNSIV